ncbi:exodeoxyribonuclease VII large subunit [Halorubrum coriense DSM 10284]|uniref:Exodeoxyribonuclease VII large subunit n=1 Tax=Halorubrum coriense DSM 10284 TaxID=1227466 RepID=M0ETQ1_9EURY|nr:exodeoxyribonuclease VII large subunit [Halorubrum coriense]ELZ50473.1 exodeoxyribonuclease VII large subunit [Halorubrum coriense DSM 10284]
MAVDDETRSGDAERDESAWSVGRLNNEIEATLESASNRFPTYVVGEVSDATAKSYGTFFTLRDVNGEETIQCIVWSSYRNRIDERITEGEEVIVRANVDFYTDGGRTQLNVKNYWAVGDSDRTQELEALRAELDEEGLFDSDQKQPLPQFPSNIGIVTSLTGSAREDVREAAWGRAPGVTLTFFGATVQGKNAPPSLVGAIRQADQDPGIDIIVVTRGGGADDTLWSFNEEPVIRAIADCRTPTVVAVGHEDDETLAEGVADKSAITPTEAGIVATPAVSTVRDRVGEIERQLQAGYDAIVTGRLDAFDRRVDNAVVSIERAAENRRAQIQRAADLEQRVDTAYSTLVSARLDSLDSRIGTGIQKIEHAAETEAVTATAARGRVAGLEARIDQAYQTRVQRETEHLERRIERGYQDIETNTDVQAAQQQAQQLRIVVLVLIGLLVLGVALWASGLL